MRWGRIVVTGLGLSGLAGASLLLSLWLLRPEPEPEPPPFPSRVATEIEQRSIIDALRQDLAKDHGAAQALPEVDPALLWFCPDGRRPTVTDDCGVMTSGAGEIIVSTSFDLDFDARPAIPKDFRLALIDANLVPGTLSSRDPAAMARERQVPSNAGGDGPGMLHVSRPIISKDGAQALLYAVYRPFPMSASGALIHLVRIDGQWQVQNAFTLWMT